MASNDIDFEEKAAEVIGLYLNPRNMQQCFVSMRRARSKRWTGSTAAYPYHQDEPSGTASSTTGTELCRCMRP
jgi:hypothetical protein